MFLVGSYRCVQSLSTGNARNVHDARGRKEHPCGQNGRKENWTGGSRSATPLRLPPKGHLPAQEWQRACHQRAPQLPQLSLAILSRDGQVCFRLETEDTAAHGWGEKASSMSRTTSSLRKPLGTEARWPCSPKMERKQHACLPWVWPQACRSEADPRTEKRTFTNTGPEKLAVRPRL